MHFLNETVVLDERDSFTRSAATPTTTRPLGSRAARRSPPRRRRGRAGPTCRMRRACGPASCACGPVGLAHARARAAARVVLSPLPFPSWTLSRQTHTLGRAVKRFASKTPLEDARSLALMSSRRRACCVKTLSLSRRTVVQMLWFQTSRVARQTTERTKHARWNATTKICNGLRSQVKRLDSYFRALKTRDLDAARHLYP